MQIIPNEIADTAKALRGAIEAGNINTNSLVKFLRKVEGLNASQPEAGKKDKGWRKYLETIK